MAADYFSGRPVATAVFAVTVGAWALLELRQLARTRPGARHRDRGSYWVVRACLTAAIFAAAEAWAHLPGAAIGGEPAPFVLGELLACAGIGLRWWATRTLGRYFTVTVQTSPDQPVIASGPYRVLRHPSYTGVELIFAGVGLLLGNWLSVVVAPTFATVALVYRIRVEEQVLEADLGDAYRAFAASRKRLVPFVW